MRRMHAGFTLIELLTVMAIIAVLASILMPAFTGAMDRSRQIVCLSNQRQIAIGITMLVQDHGGIFPASSEVWEELALGEPKVLRCPKTSDSDGIDYLFNDWLSERSEGEVFKPTYELLTVDGPNPAAQEPNEYHALCYPDDALFRHPEAKLVATFCDGHAEALHRELPPFWLEDIGGGDKEGEALYSRLQQSKYPTLLYLYTENDASTPVRKFCQALLSWQGDAPTGPVMEIAQDLRLEACVCLVREQTAEAEELQYPELFDDYGLDPDDLEVSLPAFVLVQPGRDTWVIAGLPTREPDDEVYDEWSDERWAEKAALAKDKVLARVREAMRTTGR